MDNYSINRKIFNIILLFVIVLFSCFCSMRFFGIDNDYVPYSQYFESMRLFSDIFDSRFEIGYSIFQFFVKKILYLNFDIFLFLIAFISLYIKSIMFSETKYALLILVIYFFSMGLMHEMTQLRAAVAIALSYLSIYQYSKGNKKKAIFFTILAATFHISVLFTSFIYFIPKNYFLTRYFWRSKLFLQSVLILISVYLILLFLTEHNQMLKLYADRAEVEQFNFLSIRILGVIPILFIGGVNYRDLDGFGKLCFYISFIGFFVTPATSSIPTLASRLFEMSFIAYFFWIPRVVKTGARWACLCMLSCICFYMFYRNVFLFPIFN
ncbi:EpsG family protein [Hafnia alvei]|uniref:EpsG family protein n=1 Tax=Hafnia alvei TaxID=569 RepID=A0A172X0S9_HAFAL|nr:EpsG family protein [Hafnia alvei]ANF30173.1 hypothetical protein [Hafnia alvei]TBM13616.1 EpsG family protein [Hafnia alvei]